MALCTKVCSEFSANYRHLVLTLPYDQTNYPLKTVEDLKYHGDNVRSCRGFFPLVTITLSSTVWDLIIGFVYAFTMYYLFLF